VSCGRAVLVGRRVWDIAGTAEQRKTGSGKPAHRGAVGLEVVKAGDRVPAYRGIAGSRYAREVALVGRAIERVQRRTEAFS
jgi:hypothetical protein